MPERPAIADLRCRGCGSTSRPGQRFCPQCGLTLSATDVAEVKPPLFAGTSPPASGADWRWLEIKRIGWLFALLLGSSLVGATVGRFDSSPWPQTIEAGFDAIVVLTFAALRFPQLSALFRLPRLELRTSIGLLLLAAAFIAGMSIYFKTVTWIGVPILRIADIYEKAGWPIVSMVLLVSIMPAVIEEIAFRGVIQSALERIVGAREALFIQAALFSVLHLLPLMFVSHFLMGMCFGFMRLRSRSLYPGMALHASWNALVLLQELRYL